MKRIPITKEGLEKLKEELNHIKSVDRPQNVRAIEEARSHGDLSENAEYHAAKERQAFIDGKITELESVIGKAEVIDVDTGPADRAVFGRTVLLYNIETEEEISYQLLGPYESEPEKVENFTFDPARHTIEHRGRGKFFVMDENDEKVYGPLTDYEKEQYEDILKGE